MLISASNNQFTKGTVLMRQKAGVLSHFGVLIDGNRVVSVYQHADKVVCETLEKFAKGNQLSAPRKFNQNPEMAYRNAKFAIGRPFNYRLLSNNCEHFVSRACGLSGNSEQAEIFGGAAGAVAVYQMTKNPWLALLGFVLGAASMDSRSEKDNNKPAH